MTDEAQPTQPMNDENEDEAGNGAPAAGGADTPADRIATLEAERNELKDRMLRIAAEFENFKKRARITQAEGEAAARERVLRDVLEIADNLERAAAMTGPGGAVDGAAVLKGVTLVLRVLQQKLERHDVKAFESKGEVFDPRVHEAISRVESADAPAGAVAVELQKGYRIGDKLLRAAMVSVSTGPAAADAGKPAGK
jgi:molecular chaperone GrpE